MSDHIDIASPAPIDDAPAVCLVCSSEGASEHECMAPEGCPCSSALCTRSVRDGTD